MEAPPTYDHRSDEALVAAANGGDSSAFEAIYYRYKDWVVGLAYRLTGDQDDALDVLQDTFRYLLKKSPGFQLSAKMTTFLYPVVQHLSIRIRRKRRRHVSDHEIVQQVARRPSEDHGSREELAAALAALPEGQTEVLLMRFVDQMTLGEIGEALDIPLGTVKSRLHNALKTLRDDERTRKYFQI